MDETWWTLMDIVGPAILLILLIALAFWAKRRNRPEDVERSERGTRELYEDEEQRRRDGVDGL